MTPRNLLHKSMTVKSNGSITLGIKYRTFDINVLCKRRNHDNMSTMKELTFQFSVRER